MFEVVLSKEAEGSYAGADRPLAKEIARCLSRLESDPKSGNNIRRLTGPLAAYYRYRIGDWRVVYQIDQETQTVLVVTIAHRRDVYD